VSGKPSSDTVYRPNSGAAGTGTDAGAGTSRECFPKAVEAVGSGIIAGPLASEVTVTCDVAVRVGVFVSTTVVDPLVGPENVHDPDHWTLNSARAANRMINMAAAAAMPGERAKTQRFDRVFTGGAGIR